MIKYVLLLFLGLYIFPLNAQIKKPEYVIVVNDKIVSEKDLNEYAEKGYLKSMNKGVTEKERDRLAQLLGNQIGEPEFIIKIDLFTDEELKNRPTETVAKTEEVKTTNEYKVNIGQQAPDFDVKMLDNTTLKLSNLKGKVVLLNFWATWCAPCLMEFHEMPDKILIPLKDTDFVFIPVAIGEDQTTVQKRMDKLNKAGINFIPGYDLPKNIWDKYATGAIPKNVIIDKNGEIKYLSIGNNAESVDKLLIEIRKLL